MRTMIIGDIHACYEEFDELLHKLEIKQGDRIISVGDLVCKGPSSSKILDRVMNLPNFWAVMGNHDYYLVKNWEAGCLEELTGTHAEAVREMGGRLDIYMRYLKSLPFYIDLPEVTVVHAGFLPGIPLDKQDPHDLIHMRTLKDGSPWYMHYLGSKLVVFGHWAKQGLIVRDNVIGLDSGCVYGRKLSACVLPERKIVSVKAHKAYAPVKNDP